VAGVSCTLTISSCCLAATACSMPGSAAAILRNSACVCMCVCGGVFRGVCVCVCVCPVVQHTWHSSPQHMHGHTHAHTSQPHQDQNPTRTPTHLDVEARLGAGFNKVDRQLARLGVPLLQRHLPGLVTTQARAHTCRGVTTCISVCEGQSWQQGESSDAVTQQPRHTCLPPQKTPHLLSTRSVLLPTRNTMTSEPRSVRTSWIQRTVLRNDCRPVGVERW
jgi:hypothetical protein